MRIESGRKSAPAFITKEMALRDKFAFVSSSFCSLFELCLQKKDEETLGINLRDLDIAVRVTVEKELVRDGSWQEVEERNIFLRKLAKAVSLDVTLNFTSNCFVNLRNKFSHFGDELNESFRNKENTVLFAKVRALADDVSELGSDLNESHLLCFHLFADKAGIDTCSNSAF